MCRMIGSKLRGLPLRAKTPQILLIIPDSSATNTERMCFDSPASRGSGSYT